MEDIINKLKNSEFTLSSDNPDIMIVDLNFQRNHIIGRLDDLSYVILTPREIEYVESSDSVTEAYAQGKKYIVEEKLYEIEGLFSTKGFVRISKSAVVNIKYIKNIKPTYNTKFIVTMKSGAVMDVTRTYYYMFKKYLGL